MNNNLKQILQTTLNLTEAGLINLIAKYPESEYCFDTLNDMADRLAIAEKFNVVGIDVLPSHIRLLDFIEFVTVECAE